MDLISQATHKSGQNSNWDLPVTHNSDNTSYAPTGKPHTKMTTTTTMNPLRTQAEQLEKNFSS
eukprot:scaffold192541_cov64-Cyclotella_meneghiniana.AAC.8